MKVVRKTLTANYADFHQKDQEIADFFGVDFSSNSSAALLYRVSNPLIAGFKCDENGVPERGEDGKLRVQVNGCGTSVIEVIQKPNALYTGVRYILTVNVLPDPALKPQVQIRLTQRNLTALAESVGARAFAVMTMALPETAAPAPLAAAANTDRSALPPRPGDVIEYTVTGLNLTPGSVWQASELKDAIDEKLALDADSVQIAPNYQTHSTQTHLGTPAFYAGFDWDALDWADVDASDYSFTAPTLTKGIPSVYGGQSTSVRFTATVQDGLGVRPGEDGKLPTISNEPGGTGGYGKDVEDVAPGEVPEDNQLVPGVDIVYVGDDPVDPDVPADPDNPVLPDPVPVLPKDPVAADIITTVKVDTIGTIEEHADDRILVGDVLQVTVESTNVAPDSKLANAVLKTTLPKGMEPKPGTIRFIDDTGKVYPVSDSAYDPKTGIVAVNAGDIYGGESVKLVLDVEVVSTVLTRNPGGSDDPNDPGNPGNPSDPDGPGNPDDPSGPGDSDDPDNPDPGSSRPEEPIDRGLHVGRDAHRRMGARQPLGAVGSRTTRTARSCPASRRTPPRSPSRVPRSCRAAPGRTLEDEYISAPGSVDEDMPPVLPSSPKVDGKDGQPDIRLTKTAQNLSRSGEVTYVGDTVRYTVTLSNGKAHSVWYDAAIRDVLPRGVDPVASSFMMIGPDGVERSVAADAYDPATRVLAVSAGDLVGGTTVSLVFDCTVTGEAVGADIGNVASAYGTTPSGVDVGSVTGDTQRPVAGDPYTPPNGWDELVSKSPSVSNATAPAYAPGTTAAGGTLRTEAPTPLPGGQDDQEVSGPADDGSSDGAGGSLVKLVKSGDSLMMLVVGLVAVAAVALVVVLLAFRSRSNASKRGAGRHVR